MSRPARVLQVLMCDGIGGTETMLADLVERLDRTAVATEVATLSGYGPVAERMAGIGIRVRSLGHDASLGLAGARLARVIRRNRYDVVCGYGFKAAGIARVAVHCMSRQARFICGVRGLHVTEVEHVCDGKARAAMAVERLGTSLVDIYDANSTGALSLLANAGVPDEKLRYIPNGLDLSCWPAADLKDTPEPVILCVARFVARKRHIDLVRAAELLLAAGVRFRLVFVGDGPLLGDVQAAARQGPAAGSIDFRGPLRASAVKEELAAADICCLASRWEGMANSVMEAMAAGRPVVGTNVNGIADLVVHRETGLLVEPEDPATMAAAIAELVADVAVRRRFAEAARARVARHFTIEAMVDAKTSLYRELARAA